MKELVTLTDIRKLEERYPFNEQELEILIRCYENLQRKKDNEGDSSFLVTLALSSPYSHYFLPDDTQGKDRVVFLEDHILPAGFANKLRAAMSSDAFVEYANQQQDKSLERFIEGVADTGRRGSKQALSVLYSMAGGGGGECAKAEALIDFCYRLAIATEALVAPNLDREACLLQANQLEPVVQAMMESLEREGELTLQTFVGWAERHFPMLSVPLSTFVHTLLFHEDAYPQGRIPYKPPLLDRASDIFTTKSSALLTTLFLATPLCGGKWQCLYSYERDARSFLQLDFSLLGYPGPTLLVVRTTESAILGAFSNAKWKDQQDFYGNRESFLFQLAPSIQVHPAVGKDSNFMYLHTSATRSPLVESSSSGKCGLGFGGSLEKPRLFIPETFTGCSADFLDRTYSSGILLPDEALEKFEIQELEVWAVGGESVITESLKKQEEHREIKNATLEEARKVHDKSFLVQDFQSGLLDLKVFGHQDQMRGRHEFRVDEQHGGYKVDH